MRRRLVLATCLALLAVAVVAVLLHQPSNGVSGTAGARHKRGASTAAVAATRSSQAAASRGMRSRRSQHAIEDEEILNDYGTSTKGAAARHVAGRGAEPRHPHRGPRGSRPHGRLRRQNAFKHRTLGEYSGVAREQEAAPEAAGASAGNNAVHIANRDGSTTFRVLRGARAGKAPRQKAEERAAALDGFIGDRAKGLTHGSEAAAGAGDVPLDDVLRGSARRGGRSGRGGGHDGTPEAQHHEHGAHHDPREGHAHRGRGHRARQGHHARHGRRDHHGKWHAAVEPDALRRRQRSLLAPAATAAPAVVGARVRKAGAAGGLGGSSPARCGALSEARLRATARNGTIMIAISDMKVCLVASCSAVPLDPRHALSGCRLLLPAFTCCLGSAC